MSLLSKIQLFENPLFDSGKDKCIYVDYNKQYPVAYDDHSYALRKL